MKLVLSDGKEKVTIPYPELTPTPNLTHSIHLWYIYLHLVDYYGKCWYIQHIHGCVMGYRNILDKLDMPSPRWIKEQGAKSKQSPGVSKTVPLAVFQGRINSCFWFPNIGGIGDIYIYWGESCICFLYPLFSIICL